MGWGCQRLPGRGIRGVPRKEEGTYKKGKYKKGEKGAAVDGGDIVVSSGQQWVKGLRMEDGY